MTQAFLDAVADAMQQSDAPPGLEQYIEAAAQFAINAGVPESIMTAENPLAVVCTAIAANDVFNAASGEVKLSQAFIMIAAQLRAGGGGR